MTTASLPLLEYVPDSVWLKEHQLTIMGGAIRTRMTVLRLDGGLCLHSPVMIDDSTREDIEKLGKVIALVAPSNCHHLYFTSAQQAFPQARTFGTVGVPRARKALERILAWDFKRAVIAHGDLLNRSPHDAIREAWQWLLRS